MIKCYGYECEVQVGRYPADFGQIENSPRDLCRMGDFRLNKERACES